MPIAGLAAIAEWHYQRRLAADFPRWMPPIAPAPTRRAIPTVYLLYDCGGALLYVGASRILSARLRQHRQRSHWWAAVVRIEIRELPTWQEATKEEARVINTHKPKHNIRRKGWKVNHG